MIASLFSEDNSIQVANLDIPGFPGAAYSRVHFIEVEMAFASACSLPPPPTINTFIFAYP